MSPSFNCPTLFWQYPSEEASQVENYDSFKAIHHDITREDLRPGKWNQTHETPTMHLLAFRRHPAKYIQPFKPRKSIATALIRLCNRNYLRLNCTASWPVPHSLLPLACCDENIPARDCEIDLYWAQTYCCRNESKLAHKSNWPIVCLYLIAAIAFGLVAFLEIREPGAINDEDSLQRSWKYTRRSNRMR